MLAIGRKGRSCLYRILVLNVPDRLNKLQERYESDLQPLDDDKWIKANNGSRKWVILPHLRLDQVKEYIKPLRGYEGWGGTAALNIFVMDRPEAPSCMWYGNAR